MAKIYQGQPGTSDTLLFTAERRYTHLSIILTNTTSSDATITLNLAYQGAAASASNQLLGATTIPANKGALCEFGVEIKAGDTIRASQGTNAAITLTIDALDITSASHSRGSSFALVPPAAVSGSGTPSGAAGGDLTGTYPNPTLAAIGSPTGPLGTALRVPVITDDAKGRVTALTDIAIALGATGDATGTLPGALTLATVNSNVGTFGDGINALTLTLNGKGLVTAASVVPQEVFTSASPTTTYTATYTTARVHKLTLGGNTVITLAGATNAVACGLTFYLIQDGTGSRLPTFSPVPKWPAGISPTFSTTAGATDIVVMETTDGGTTWFANLAGKAYA